MNCSWLIWWPQGRHAGFMSQPGPEHQHLGEPLRPAGGWCFQDPDPPAPAATGLDRGPAAWQQASGPCGQMPTWV